MRTIALWIGILGTACAATVGTNGSFYVPKEAASTCSSHCHEIGLVLSSVVIMANNVGCVCGVASGAPGSGAAASGGGMAAMLIAQQRQSAATGAAYSSSVH